MTMRRADRRTSNDDNANNYPRSQRRESASPRELESLLMTVRSQRDEWQQKAEEYREAAGKLVQVQQEIETYQVQANEWEKRANQNHQLYFDEQQKYQQTLYLYDAEKVKATEWLTRYEEANAQKEQYLTLYSEEQIKATEWLTKYKEADAQRQQYLTLYQEVQEELKYERRSKAGIKGWETRRKRENERLKREIGEMTIILRESLARKDEAVNDLYFLAERMDRIQELIDSVDEESINTPLGLLQKFKRIWLAIREILND